MPPAASQSSSHPPNEPEPRLVGTFQPRLHAFYQEIRQEKLSLDCDKIIARDVARSLGNTVRGSESPREPQNRQGPRMTEKGQPLFGLRWCRWQKEYPKSTALLMQAPRSRGSVGQLF